MNTYDVAIIGAGVVGSEIFRRLTSLGLLCVLVERSSDVAEGGASKANSGLVHAGFDCKPGTLKAKLNVRGAKLYPELCKRLSVHFRPSGAIVAAEEEDREHLFKLWEQGQKNGVPDLRVIERDEILKLVPTLHPRIACALYAPTAGIVSPYEMTIACAEEGVLNGGTVRLNFPVTSLSRKDGVWTVSDGTEKLTARAVINSAGAQSNKINALAGAEPVSLSFRRGEYVLLDLTEGELVKTTVFPLPTAKGKGILVTPTAHGNLMLGPPAADTEDPTPLATQEGMAAIRTGVTSLVGNINFRKGIRIFAGTRVSSGDDFIIETSKLCENYVYLAGICSPGLSSAPAISEYVAALLTSFGFTLEEKPDPILRKPIPSPLGMPKAALNELIKRDPAFGRIVCRCEKITEGEIVAAIKSPIPAVTVDAIKRRTRAGMGRCQGGFCMPRVTEIIARETGVPLENVTKRGKGSELLIGNIKEVQE